MDRLHGFIGKLISWLLIITTQGMAAHIAYAQDEFSKAVQEANQFTSQLLNKRSVPSIDSSIFTIYVSVPPTNSCVPSAHIITIA